MNKPLEGHTIIDLSHRLPGPLAGHLLSRLGAEVIKIEDHKFKDPFSHGIFSQVDQSFQFWYEALNKNKSVQFFDFSSKEDVLKIQQIISSADGIIMGLPLKVQTKLGLDHTGLHKLNNELAVISLKASKKDHGALHDLNALGLAGLLDLYIQSKSKVKSQDASQDYGEDILDPPFLPLAGIAFGQKLAMSLLAHMIKAKKEKGPSFGDCYLLESTEEVFGPFFSEKLRETKQRKFLHNGLYPCYSLYRTKDQNYVALAAVEEKFWLQFCTLFNLKLEAKDRFHFQDDSVFLQIRDKIKSLHLFEIQKLIQGHDICLTAIAT